MHCVLSFLVILAALIVCPSIAVAQAAIVGVVRDASGAVLPGVMVEASSPALIEKVRVVTTDGGGQFRIVDLRPGIYTIAFTLPGFSLVRREGVELTGSFTASVDAEMRVGTLEETITVTGDAPMVDVQTVTRQRVIDRDLIDALPTGRSPFALSVLIPGVSVGAANQDVGGATQLSGAVAMQVHGSTGNSTMIMENGLSTAALVGAWGSQLSFNMAAAQEVAVDFSGTGADVNAAGVKMNVIQREGGNRFSGTLFMNGTTSALQGDNFSQRLRALGLRTPDSIRKIYEINPGLGGPLRQDTVWFYAAARYAFSSKWAAGEFRDRNFNDVNAWLYDPDPARPVSNDSNVKDGRLRLTWQAAPRVKIGSSYQQQTALNWPSVRDLVGGAAAGATLLAYEGSIYHSFPLERQVMLDVLSPLTSRLLVDVGTMYKVERALRDPVPGLSRSMISVLDQSTGRQYRARDQYINQASYVYSYRAAVSYITGAHALKVGVGDITGHLARRDFDNLPVSYRFNAGVPNLITMRALPVEQRVDINHQFGAYVQDRWTVRRLTINAGLRYDWFNNSFPAQAIGPAPLAPGRNISFEAIDNLSLRDLNPKLGVVYDLSANGKTALKLALNRYVEPYTQNGIAGSRNPISRLTNSTTRSWTDANRDYVPDCNLLNLASNGECGGVMNTNFGSTNPEVNFDTELLTGWGKRDFNWELSAGVQREIVPRVSVDVSYFRRWYGNFIVTDNLAVGAADFDTFQFTAPTDARLPGGGGYTVSGLYNVNPTKFGQVGNYTTFSKNHGGQSLEYNGFSATANARPRSGLTLQGGVDTGITTADTCDLRRQLPEIAPLNPFCRTDIRLTQVKVLGSYTVPKIDVQVSSTFQSLPGPQIAANVTVPNALVQPSLGRPLSGSATNVTVNVVEPGTLFGERLHQLDFRFGRILRFGHARAVVSVDLYNALNVDTVLTLNSAFASWQQPQSAMLARFAKLGVQIDF